jgi:hypothetical protein
VDDEVAAWLRVQAEADIWRAEKAAGVFMDSPRTEAARAESVLAVLDEHEAAAALAEAEAAGLRGVLARACLGTLGRTVLLLAYGYRYREGWREGWKP